MTKYLLGYLVGFGFSLVAVPLVFWLVKKMGMKQTILFYVKEHFSKEGTPTMGGIVFLLGLIFSTLVFLGKNSTLALVSVAGTLSFGIVGFLDDFIKLKFKQNLGLKPYQKIIGQFGISLILAIFAYNFVGSEIIVPFTLTKIDLGWFFIPFVMIVFIAVVNSVNLIDGLDGLSTGVSCFYILGFMSFLILFLENLNLNSAFTVETQNIILICSIMLGCLTVFFLINAFPAQIFMGDTGSLAIGGFVACISIFTKFTLIIPILGIMYVITAVSDIIQVCYYKLKKKRVFKMAPIHHHFQMSGLHENKVVVIYIVITVLVSVLNLLLTNIFYIGV